MENRKALDQQEDIAKLFILEPEDWTVQEWAVLCKLFSLPAATTERIVFKTDQIMSFEGQPKGGTMSPVASVKTPLGTITVTAAVDRDHPGFWLDLMRPGESYDLPLALVEYCADEADQEDGPHIITRVWGDVEQEEYSVRIVHQGVQKDPQEA